MRHLQVAAQEGRVAPHQVVQGGKVVLLQAVQGGRVLLLQAVQGGKEELRPVAQGGMVVHPLVVQRGRVQICLCNENVQSHRFVIVHMQLSEVFPASATKN